MGVLVGKEPGLQQRAVWVGQCAFSDAIIAAFMVFLAERKHVVAKREQEMVVAVMLRLIKRLGLSDQLLVLLNQRRRNLERPGIIGHHVQFVGRGLPRF